MNVIRKGLLGLSLWLLLLSVLVLSWSSPPEQFDVLIKNTTIVDGTGREAFKGDVGIRGEKIVAVGQVNGEASLEIDGTGLVTCPGFIDPHNHADFSLLIHPDASLAVNLIMQGITTVTGGNCGMSSGPRKKLSLGKWLSRVEKNGVSVNYAPLVGHGTVRSDVMGKDFKRHATSDEIEKMKALVDAAMKDGAFGLSSGLDYYPGEYADQDEIIELAKVARKYGGKYFTHHRGHNSNWQAESQEEWGYGVFHGPVENAWVGRYRGLVEAIEICRQAKIPLHVSHLVSVYRIPQPHPDFLEEAAAKATLWIMDKAREEGLEITADVIITTYNVSSMAPLINEFLRSRTPALKWLKKYKKDEFIEGLKTGELRQKIKDIYQANRLKLGKIHTKSDPYWMERFKIMTCQNKDYEEKTIAELSQIKNKDPLDLIFDILVEDPETKWMQFRDERNTEPAVAAFLRHPLVMPCSDVVAFPPIVQPEGYLVGAEFMHPPPLAFNMYADYLGNYVRDKRYISLEEAIRKATSLPAKLLGLEDRGILGEGVFADLVVFDFQKIKAGTDFRKPAQPPEGIEYVLVNGQLVYEKKAHTGVESGKVLRRE